MLGYRAFFEVQNEPNVLALAQQQLHTWLRSKKYDADCLGAGGVQDLAAGVSGVLLDEEERDGSRSVRARIVEDSGAGGRWTTELTVHRAGRRGRSWVWLDVERPDAAPWAAPPRLAGRLVEVLPAWDGPVRLSHAPRVVRGDDVVVLARELQAPGRRGLAFVAGSDASLPLDRWTELVGKLLRQSSGLATGFVLDPAATEHFAALMGPTHDAPAGALRTYEPGVVIGDRADALRHRILSTHRIVHDTNHHLSRILGGRAQDLALGAPLPGVALRLDRHFRDRLDDLLAAGARTGSAPDPGTPELRAAPASQVVLLEGSARQRRPEEQKLRDAFASLLFTVTGSTALTLEAVQVLAGLHQQSVLESAAAMGRDAAVDQLRTRIRDLELGVDNERAARLRIAGELDDELVERALAEQERSEAQTWVRSLQERLRPHDVDGSIWVPPAPDPTDVAPETIEDLLERVDGNELDRVTFTGHRETALDLDLHHLTGVHARKAWEALCALQDYATETAAGRCAMGVHDYLTQTPAHCRGFSANRHARTESEDVQKNPKFRKPRLLPVPVGVNAAGEVQMYAHFKLTKSGMTSPRLHYWDDTSDSGKIFVGYIGRHLPTQQTN